MRTLYTRIGKLGTVQAENTNTITNCSGVFYNCDSFTKWNKSLRDLVVGCKTFDNCSNLTTFTGNLESLVVGDEMFNDCTSLTTFTSGLPSLKSAYSMFTGCKLIPEAVENIADTIKDINELDRTNEGDWQCSIKGENYIIPEEERGRIDIDWDSEHYNERIDEVKRYCLDINDKGWNVYLNGVQIGVQITTYLYVDFNSEGDIASYDLTGLEDGYYLYAYTKLSSFDFDLPKMTNGEGMFYQCTSLTSFDSELSSLQAGNDMFTGCKLTPDSVKNISETIKDIKDFVDWDASIAEENRGKIDIDWDSINYADSTNIVKQYCKNIARKGWYISLGGEIITEYIILTEPYNRDWSVNNNLNSLTNNGALRITSVVNSEIYQDGEKIIEMNPPTSDIVDVSGGNGTGMFSYTALASFNSDLSKLTDGSSMFYKCTALASFNSDLSKLTDGSSMFENCILDESSVQNIATTINNLASQNKSGRIDLGINSSIVDDTDVVNSITTIAKKGWDVYVNGELFELLKSYVEFNSDGDVVSYDLSGIEDGSYMFAYTTLESFNGDLSSLTNGNSMFYKSALESFNSDLSSLTNGNSMFTGCSSLTSFDSKLPNLTDGSSMFKYCTNLASFNSDLKNLTNGYRMFYNTALASFDSDLSNLTSGTRMFSYTALASFDSKLPNLIYGTDMFDGCKLDTASIQNIASTINTVSSGSYITIGIQASLEGTTEINNAISTIQSKGWTVTAQYNA